MYIYLALRARLEDAPDGRRMWYRVAEGGRMQLVRSNVGRRSMLAAKSCKDSSEERKRSRARYEEKCDLGGLFEEATDVED